MKITHWLTILPAIGILGGTPFVNRAAPLVLGFPPILLWLAAWVVATAVIMAIVYALDPANRGTTL
jgi:hypothetical protein